VKVVPLIAGLALLAPAPASAQPRLVRELNDYLLTTDSGDDAVRVQSVVNASGPSLQLAPTGATAVPWSLDPSCRQDPHSYAVTCAGYGVPLTLQLGAGADRLDGAASPSPLVVDGGPGADVLTGSPYDDSFQTRDGEADTVDCGAGRDTVVADRADILTGCEVVDVPPLDVPPDVPPAASPPVALAPVSGSIASSFLAGRRFTRVVRLSVHGAPANGRIELRCRGGGCPARLISRLGPTASFTNALHHARLRPGAVLELRLTAPDAMGRVVRYTVRRAAIPRSARLCLAPGASAPAACG
jgi:hypothetical protein